MTLSSSSTRVMLTETLEVQRHRRPTGMGTASPVPTVKQKIIRTPMMRSVWIIYYYSFFEDFPSRHGVVTSLLDRLIVIVL